jgi:hypothetical protein
MEKEKYKMTKLLRKFYAYSEYGFKYTGYMVGDKVLLIPSM